MQDFSRKTRRSAGAAQQSSAEILQELIDAASWFERQDRQDGRCGSARLRQAIDAASTLTVADVKAAA